MFTSKIIWDGKQNIVVISHSEGSINIPLDDFLELKAVRYVIELAQEQTDLGLVPKAPQPALN
jgi:hypothetical protein